MHQEQRIPFTVSGKSEIKKKWPENEEQFHFFRVPAAASMHERIE